MRPTHPVTAILTILLLAGCTTTDGTDPSTTTNPAQATPTATGTPTSEPTPSLEPTTDPTQTLLDEATAFVIQVMADSDAAAQTGYTTEAADAALAHYAGDARLAQVQFIETVHEYNLTQVGSRVVDDVELVELTTTQYGPQLVLRVCIDSTGTEVLRDGASQGGEPAGRNVVKWTVAEESNWLVYVTEPMPEETC